MSVGNNNNDDLPLCGVRVLDLSRLLPGPFCSQLLVDLGAQVIKIEDEQGDYARYYPPLTSDGNSAIFHGLNRGKLSVKLDLKLQPDKEIFIKLLSTADVLIDSFRPGVMDKLGLGSDKLMKLYPKLIICSITGYGLTGPDSLRAGHDVNYLAKAGVLSMHKNPQLLPVQVADIAGGAYPATIQILAALRKRDRTGKGSIIDVSMCDNSYSLLVMPQAKRSYSGDEISGGKDILSGAVPCYDIYKTKDGYITVGALEPKFWQPLVKQLGLPQLTDEQFATGEDGIKVRNELQSVLSSKTNNEWKDFFSKRDLMCEIIEPAEDIAINNKHFKDRNVSVTIKVSDNESLTVPAMPLRMTGVKPIAQRAPLLGEHTQQILQQLKSKL